MSIHAVSNGKPNQLTNYMTAHCRKDITRGGRVVVVTSKESHGIINRSIGIFLRQSLGKAVLITLDRIMIFRISPAKSYASSSRPWRGHCVGIRYLR